ncbi:MAG: hypothetical protein EOP47_30945 [Sphingobacteriaceae bacterium]|nr:MAG: hypothetical protein EOP47_30945 [Sphingobacteriaceae bacterium]
MFKKLIALLMAVIALASCEKSNSDCRDKICTDEFAMVTVKFLDTVSEPVNVKNFSAVNQRTKDTIRSNQSYNSFEKGVYVVVDDNYRKNLADSGDNILVSATDSISHQTKTAVIKVAGGECACHIKKLSGAEKIKFD